MACAAGGTRRRAARRRAVAPRAAQPATTPRRCSASLRTFPLLDGYRGAPRADVAALEDILVRISALAAAHPEIAELDCNPVLVGTGGATVVDARVRIAAPPPARPYPSLDR